MSNNPLPRSPNSWVFLPSWRGFRAPKMRKPRIHHHWRISAKARNYHSLEWIRFMFSPITLILNLSKMHAFWCICVPLTTKLFRNGKFHWKYSSKRIDRWMNFSLMKMTFYTLKEKSTLVENGNLSKTLYFHFFTLNSLWCKVEKWKIKKEK